MEGAMTGGCRKCYENRAPEWRNRQTRGIQNLLYRRLEPENADSNPRNAKIHALLRKYCVSATRGIFMGFSRDITGQTKPEPTPPRPVVASEQGPTQVLTNGTV